MSDDLVKRLRGEYRIPITDGLGAAGGEEPDNAFEFVRRSKVPKIQVEAAARIVSLEMRIVELQAENARLRDAAQEVHDDLLRRGLDRDDPETQTKYRLVSIGRSAWSQLCAALEAKP